MTSAAATRAALLALAWVLVCVPAGARAAKAKHVHVTHMNHLDVGFTMESFDVINEYFDKYFPAAVIAANECRIVHAERYIYTTHPFLVSLYLDCPPGGLLHCPTPKQRQEFVEVVAKGDIVWHAFPHNAQVEVNPQWLFGHGLGLSAQLAAAANVSAPTVMSQRDVPGLTRAAVPLLAARGIRAVSVGVNHGSMPPSVPKLFKWQDLPSGKELLGLWHPGGYGGIAAHDCVHPAGSEHVLCMFFRGDNQGPASALEWVGILEAIRVEFLGAEVRASTFDGFIDAIAAEAGVLDLLPAVTEEISDTWLYGIQSDPYKLAALRSIGRAADQCLSSGACDPSDPAFANFTRWLVKLSEHTWGIDIKRYLNDETHWTNTAFEQARSGSNFLKCERSWHGQRSYVDQALSALEVRYQSLADEMRTRLAALTPEDPPQPAAEGFEPISPGKAVNFTQFTGITVDPTTGGITSLYARNSGIQWASPQHPLGLVKYQTLNMTDYWSFFDRYMYIDWRKEVWIQKDYGKPGLENFPTKSQWWAPAAVRAWARTEAGQQGMLVELTYSDEAVKEYGAPQSLWVRYIFNDGADMIECLVSWFGKTPTRIPEALWIEFAPTILAGARTHSSPTGAGVRVPRGRGRAPGHRTPASLSDSRAPNGRAGAAAAAAAAATDTPILLGKMGSWINPLDVNVNGSRHLHGIDDGGVVMSDGNNFLTVMSLDAALVSPGEPMLLPGDKNSGREKSDGREVILWPEFGANSTTDLNNRRRPWYPAAKRSYAYALATLNGNPPDLARGVSFNMVNNLWGTNYVMWYPFAGVSSNAMFRFEMAFAMREGSEKNTMA